MLVVGGGPAGFTTAIALAVQGCTDIVLLERSPSVDYFEPTKSFVFGLFPHSKDVLRKLGLTNIDRAGAATPHGNTSAHPNAYGGAQCDGCKMYKSSKQRS